MRHVLQLAGQRCGPSQPVRHDGGGVVTLQVGAELGSPGWLVDSRRCYR
jgi:hypothetical protein